jgi:hypothetical protein
LGAAQADLIDSICRHSLFTRQQQHSKNRSKSITVVLLPYTTVKQSTMSTTEKQIAHAHKVSQMVTDYHSKMAITKHRLTDNPSADIGIFNKLAPASTPAPMSTSRSAISAPSSPS